LWRQRHRGFESHALRSYLGKSVLSSAYARDSLVAGSSPTAALGCSYRLGGAADDTGVAVAEHLDQLLSDHYPGERLADDFHERRPDARDNLRRKVQPDD
jgi:hypothetical protein